MGLNRDGSWRADRLEPFNAAMDGISLDPVRDATADPTSYGRARIVTWLFAVVCIALGLVGPSVFFLVVGALLGLVALWWTLHRVR